MIDRGIYTGLVHQADRLVGGEGRHLPMGEVARQSGSPEVNLRIDDLHFSLAFCFGSLTRRRLVIALVRGECFFCSQRRAYSHIPRIRVFRSRVTNGARAEEPAPGSTLGQALSSNADSAASEMNLVRQA